MTATDTRPARPKGWTAQRMHQALYEHLSGQGWAVLEEVTLGDDTAYDEQGRWTGAPTARRIDVLAVRTPKRPTTGGVTFGTTQTLAVEIKVSRQDFSSDVNDPAKQAPWRAATHQHAYAVPEHLVDVADVPEGSGLLVVREVEGYASWAPGGKTTVLETSWAKRAPYSDGALPERFLRDFAWRAASAEARLRGRTQPDREDDPVALHAEIRRLRDELTKTGARADRDHAAAARWRQIATAGGYPVPCGTCGHPVRPSAVHQREEKWRHTYPEHERECAPLREAAAVAEAKERYARRREEDGPLEEWEVKSLERAGWTETPWRLTYWRPDGPLPSSDL